MSIILTDTETVEVDGFKFTVRPENYLDVMVAYREARDALQQRGVLPDFAEVMSDDARMLMGRAAVAYTIISRIEAWEGVLLPDETEAPCTQENKLKFFGKRPQTMDNLLTELSNRETSDEKNLQTSQEDS
jgi:hypothetical protein